MKYVVQFKVVVFLLALVPLANLVYRSFTNGFGANPIEYIIRDLGTWGLTFLLITLAVTPLRQLANRPWLLRLRRMFGLFAFFYVLLHFVAYLWWDQYFDWTAIWKDVLKRPFISIGFAAFLLLIPLAVTSTNKMIKRLGARRWQLLHRLVYAIAILGVLHFWWLAKRDVTQPLIFAVILAVLLGFRLIYRLLENRAEVSALRPMAQQTSQRSASQDRAFLGGSAFRRSQNVRTRKAMGGKISICTMGATPISRPGMSGISAA